MKKSIIAIVALALSCLGNYAIADETGTDHTVEVTPGDWDDDDDTKLNFNFQDIPTAKYTGLHLHLTCGLPEAQILYTTDKTATPSDSNAWTTYTEPIYLTEDCTVRFFARCEGYNDSDIQTYVFVYADHQAATPSVAPDIDRKNIVMVTETPDANIRYTFDGNEPDESSTLYAGPIAITANGTFKARSFAEDMFPSSVTDYTVDFLKAEMPSAAFLNKQLVISCEDADSKIYYTFSDAPISDADAWTLYSSPLALLEDCTVRYFASHEGYHDSEVGTFSFSYAAYQVAAPVLTANAEGTHVVMECATEGAAIRFTTDGSEPTAESQLYSAPVEIVGNGTFRARAFAGDLFDSNIVDFIVMHLAVPSPVAVFENKALVLSCSDPKAKIKYTLNADATPDNAEAWTVYEGPISLTDDCTVRFFGYRDNFNNSDIQSFTFVYSNYRVADPTIERNAEGTHIVMETSTPGATIYYTTDGSEPSAKSTVYTQPVLIEGNFTYCAIAIADGLFDSKVNSYVVSNMAVPAPSASFENLKMTLNCADEKAQIWYTTDPTASVENTEAWTLYSEPFAMIGDCTLRFFSRRPNFNDSDIESLTFVYSAYQAQAPNIDRNEQGTHIVMSTTVDGGKIHYTVDGTDPTAESPVYASPIRIQAGAVYRARVMADNMYDSEITEYIIGNDKLSVPTATYHNFTLVLSTSDEGASIWYTTDPDLSIDNVEAWTLYEAPIALSDDCIYRFFAGDDDANASDVQTFVFQRSDFQVAVPTIERNAEGTHIVMECPTEGAAIRYTTDGSEPTLESNLYSEPVLILCNGIFKARAFVEGLYDSEVTDFTVANMAVPVASASFSAKLLTLTCADTEAEIWYTIDDDAVAEETEDWQLYSAPLALTENCYVHFFSRRENFNDSDIETFVFLRANYMAESPVIERSEDGRSIIMTTATEGAEIRYTTDGTDPTQESELYTEPVFITQNCTFRARAYSEELFESAVSEFSVSNMTMMTPYAAFENLLLTLSLWDEAGEIWYTLDAEAAPEDAEAWTLYTEPLALDADCTVRFFARRAGFLDSQIAEYVFVYSDWQVAAPELTANAEGTHIVMETATPGATIHYTTDGSDPTQESELYTEPVLITQNCTFRARAYSEELFESAVSEFTVSDMTMMIPSAAFKNLLLTLSLNDEAGEIWYTLDAEAAPEDAEAWTLYTEPLALDADCTVRFFARRVGFLDSQVAEYVFVYSDWQVAAPELTVDAEGTHIVMETATPGATIHYTTDGSVPTTESTVYTEPILIEGNFTYSAMAVAEGLFDSNVNSYVVSNKVVTEPTASFSNKHLTLTCVDSEAEIWYTIDDDAVAEETEEWQLYTAPLALTENCYVHFFSRRENFNDSDIETFVFQRANYMAESPVIERSEDGSSIIMTTATEGAEIRYTTDGTDPTQESELYTEPVLITQNCTFRARAYSEEFFESAVSEFTVSDMTMMTPYASFENLMLTLSLNDEAAEIWYTLDAEAATEDVEAWTLYSEPLALEADCTVRFFARRAGFLDSKVAEYVFVYSDWQVAAPELIEDTESQIVIITCPDENAEIRYTIDGTDPTEESQLYTEPIQISGQMTIRARAFSTDRFASEISEIVTSFIVGVTTVSIDSLKVCKEGGEVVIYSDKAVTLPIYTLNGHLIKTLNVEAGRNVIDPLDSNVYIIGTTKIKL